VEKRGRRVFNAGSTCASPRRWLRAKRKKSSRITLKNSDPHTRENADFLSKASNKLLNPRKGHWTAGEFPIN